MRLSLRTQHCTSLEVFGPGTRDFTEQPAEKCLSCGGYALVHPDGVGPALPRGAGGA